MPATTLITGLEALESEFAGAIAPLRDEQEIRDTQARYLGKKGRVTELMKEMGRLDPTDRREVGQVANRVKTAITDEVARRLAELARRAEVADLERRIDVTLPGRQAAPGHAHILSQVTDEVVGIFAELGFAVAEGPEIETDFHNFEALAMPPDHPARDAHDTFYVGDGLVLRTHTSPVQIRTMLSRPPPIKIVAPGVVYRRDDDATHSPMFCQLEGLLVDEGVRLSDLKGVLLFFVRRFFAADLRIRLRASYFPFVEPGAEVDMECSFCDEASRRACRICKGTRWVEICGCGMVDPDVFAQVGYDAERFTGFAFGFGLDRMAMLRHGVTHIRHLYESDVRFLEQY
jgi:phenylalanyl-tRNA synthetase alpha chain